ncbi:MAG: MgtC/SapB family protein [Thermoplasmata archaeon]
MAVEFVDVNFIINVIIVVALGSLIGLEREHREDKTMVIAGVRTFPLTSLSGLIFSFLSANVGLALIEVGVIIFGGFALILAFLKYEVHTIGITTPVALFITFLIGIMVEQGFIFEAAFVAILITVLLLTKKRLHNIARKLGE